MPALPDALAQGSGDEPFQASQCKPFCGKRLLSTGHRVFATRDDRPRPRVAFGNPFATIPTTPTRSTTLGNAVWQQGRSSEAMAYFLRAYQFKQNDFGILNNLGIVLWEQNRPERAIEFYRRALEAQARLVRHQDEPGRGAVGCREF